MASKQTGAAKTVATKAAKVDASGAIVEQAIVDGIDTSHPAVDSNPREGTTPDMNRIDFNDPTKTPEQAVEENLADQA